MKGQSRLSGVLQESNSVQELARVHCLVSIYWLSSELVAHTCCLGVALELLFFRLPSVSGSESDVQRYTASAGYEEAESKRKERRLT